MSSRRRALGLMAVLLCLAGVGVMSGAAPAGADAASDETRFLDLTNQSRVAAGLAPVALAGDLTATARRHSNDMAAQNRMFHTSNLIGAVPGWTMAGEIVGGRRAPGLPGLAAPPRHHAERRLHQRGRRRHLPKRQDVGDRAVRPGRTRRSSPTGTRGRTPAVPEQDRGRPPARPPARCGACGAPRSGSRAASSSTAGPAADDTTRPSDNRAAGGRGDTAASSADGAAHADAGEGLSPAPVAPGLDGADDDRPAGGGRRWERPPPEGHAALTGCSQRALSWRAGPSPTPRARRRGAQ
jgi:hypothetical protein